MAEISWIKLKTDMFNSTKIRLIEKLPEGDTILVLWLRWYLHSAKDRSYQIRNFSEHTLEEFLSILAAKPIQIVTQAIPVLKEHGLVEVFENHMKIKRFWLTNQEWRNTPEYKAWRKNVFERDDYTCQKCGVRGGALNAHHIKPFAKYEGLRFELSNGITLCYGCHKEVHHG